MAISRLTKVPLRELWRHEAHSFTHWMAENLDFLSKTLGFQLTLVEREASVGTFSADIQAEDSQGNYIIIENQLEKTDHDHLSKLITYMSNLEAKTAVWITSDPRPEFETAVHWLNETFPADTSFYLIKCQ
jgi:RecB family endonuclease NucS